jgi:hypothetical protein
VTSVAGGLAVSRCHSMDNGLVAALLEAPNVGIQSDGVPRGSDGIGRFAAALQVDFTADNRHYSQAR